MTAEQARNNKFDYRKDYVPEDKVRMAISCFSSFGKTSLAAAMRLDEATVVSLRKDGYTVVDDNDYFTPQDETLYYVSWEAPKSDFSWED